MKLKMLFMLIKFSCNCFIMIIIIINIIIMIIIMILVTIKDTYETLKIVKQMNHTELN